MTPAAGLDYPHAVKREIVAARIWEIDFLRGLSVVLMVCYHLLFDLGEFVGIERFLGWSTDLSLPAWTIAQAFFAALFVVLSGTSSTLSRNNIRRGLRLLAVSALVSVATYVFDPTSVVFFGILQCLAVSMILYGAAFEKARPAICAASGAVVIGLAAALPVVKKVLAVRTDWLMPFGITSPSFSAFDYFPLIPWLGIFLAGAALGKTVYASKRSLLPWRMPPNFVNFAGRHALVIYIVHQPVIMGVLYLLGAVR